MWKHPPGYCAPENIEYGIHDLPHICCAWSSTRFGWWNQWLHDGPFCIGQVCRIRFSLHNEPILTLLRHPLSLLLLKVSAIAAFPPNGRTWILLLFPSISRWTVVMAMDIFPYVRSRGIGTPSLTGNNRRPLTASLSFTIIAALALAGPVGLFLMAAASAVCWAVCAWASRQLGGVTGDVYGAAIEISEMSVLLIAMVIARGSFFSIESPLIQLLQ